MSYVMAVLTSTREDECYHLGGSTRSSREVEKQAGYEGTIVDGASFVYRDS